MAATRTVSDLIAELRSQTDESNEIALEDGRDILPALNRAQQYAWNVLSRKYPDPIVTYTTITFVSGQQEYDLPEDTFEDRVEKIELLYSTASGYYTECRRVAYSQLTEYETNSTDPQPWYYAIVGRKIRFVPAPTSGTARVWYVRDPQKLVKDQGRITLVNTGSNYIRVDAAGDDLTTNVDELNSYVNLVNGQTGEIKATLQIQNIDDTKISFKTTPTRSTVFNRTVTGGLAALPVDVTIEQDDYICTVHGTCVAYFGDATTNFILSMAGFEMQKKLGTASGLEKDLVDKFEKQLERQWTHRENTTRVLKRNSLWQIPYRRWFTRR
jgi:hypothetical protein